MGFFNIQLIVFNWIKNQFCLGYFNYTVFAIKALLIHIYM